ncbi:hypothetical protein D9M72_274750 [compost metagenome]
MEAIFGQMAPAIQAAEHRAAGNARNSDPIEVGLHRTEPFQGRRVVSGAEIVPVALALRQEQGHAGAGFGLDMLHLQTTQLIAAEAAPETDQQQRRIPSAP